MPTKRAPETSIAANLLPAGRGRTLVGAPMVIIMATAVALFLPTLFFGIPSGHDFEFHMNSWMEVLSQWRLGILYPRWAALAHYGYGEARFIFYPPASWTLGAALGSFVPWWIVPTVYEWIALTLAGCSMFLLARRFMPSRDATFAAALYTANPYHIVTVYWRSSFAELLVSSLLPLLLLVLLRPEDKRNDCKKNDRSSVLSLGLIVAAAWLTNIPGAVMVTYSLALLLVVQAVTRRSLRPVIIGAIALLLGLALAAFYIVPVLYEQKWIEIAQVLSLGVRPQDNFIFTFLRDPDHDRFNLLISLISVAEILIMAIFWFLSREWRSRSSEFWSMLTAWWVASALLLTSVTFLLYRFLPEMRYVQLPLRWLLCLNIGFALLVTMGTRRWAFRSLACFAMLAVLAFVWHRIQPPWWDDTADIAEMLSHQHDGSGYEGIDEYVPNGVDVYEIKQDAHRVTFQGNGTSRIRITQWDPESKTFSANVSQPGKLLLKLFNYPAWKAEVNHHPVQTGQLPVTGQMVIPVDAGDHQIQIKFVRSRDRQIGGLISFGTVILILGLMPFKRSLSPS